MAAPGNSYREVVVRRARYYEGKPPILGWREGKGCTPKKGEGLLYQGKGVKGAGQASIAAPTLAYTGITLGWISYR